jgi:hypothetical protein
MPRGDVRYNELSKARISDSRNVVISQCSKGGFTVAQQLEAKEGDKTTTVFMKGAIHIETLDGLYELRDAINLAIDSSDTLDDFDSEDSDWDED